jgi:hypothetical protein
LFSLHRFFLLEVALCFVFFGVFVVCARSCAKAERPPETHHDCAVFFDRLRPRCKNPSTVLAMAALVLRLAGALRN